MRPTQQNRRMRGRNNNGGPRKSTNVLNRSYESNGPDIKVRGTAQHVAEKYAQLARDAQSSGDRVMAENYFQHAEHYNRLIAEAQEEARLEYGTQAEDGSEDANVSYDRNQRPTRDDNPAFDAGEEVQDAAFQPQPYETRGRDFEPRQDRFRQDRQDRNDRNNDRQDRNNRPDRFNRLERQPRERFNSDRFSENRFNNDRSNGDRQEGERPVGERPDRNERFSRNFNRNDRFERSDERSAPRFDDNVQDGDNGAERQPDRFDRNAPRQNQRERFPRRPRPERFDESRFERVDSEQPHVSDDQTPAGLPAFLTNPVRQSPVVQDAAPEVVKQEPVEAETPRPRRRRVKKVEAGLDMNVLGIDPTSVD